MYDSDQWPDDAGGSLRRPPERPDVSEQTDEDDHPDEYPTPKRDDPQNERRNTDSDVQVGFRRRNEHPGRSPRQKR